MRDCVRTTLRAAVVVTALLGLAASASATPLTFSVDPTQSVVDVSVTAVGTTGTDTVGLSGTSLVDLTLGTAPALEVLSSDLALDPFDILLDLGFLGSVSIAGPAVGSDFSGGPVAGSAAGTGAASFDLAGFDLFLDEGLIDISATGMAGALVSPTVRDLAVEPLAFVLPTTWADAVSTDLGGGLTEVVLTVPLDMATVVDVSGVSADLTLQGQVVLSHTFATVPEPASAALVGLGLAGLAAAGRRRPRA